MMKNHLRESQLSARGFAVALSGGSTPRRLYSLLSREQSISNRLPWEAIHFFWGDERHVPPNHAQSNYRMARESLFASAPVPLQNIHRVHAEESDAAAAADKYDMELATFFKPEKGQLPRFDCILLGIGSDGHTASLFPGTQAVREKKRLVVANWVDKLQSYRITLTAPVINNAALVIFMVSGREKAEILKEILEGDHRPDTLPAQLIRPVNGSLVWLVDQAAGACLSNF